VYEIFGFDIKGLEKYFCLEKISEICIRTQVSTRGLESNRNFYRCVTSLNELWEGNGKEMHEISGQTYGNVKGTGNVPMKKNCQRQQAIFFENH